VAMMEEERERRVSLSLADSDDERKENQAVAVAMMEEERQRRVSIGFDPLAAAAKAAAAKAAEEAAAAMSSLAELTAVLASPQGLDTLLRESEKAAKLAAVNAKVASPQVGLGLDLVLEKLEDIETQGRGEAEMAGVLQAAARLDSLLREPVTLQQLSQMKREASVGSFVCDSDDNDDLPELPAGIATRRSASDSGSDSAAGRSASLSTSVYSELSAARTIEHADSTERVEKTERVALSIDMSTGVPNLSIELGDKTERLDKTEHVKTEGVALSIEPTSDKTVRVALSKEPSEATSEAKDLSGDGGTTAEDETPKPATVAGSEKAHALASALAAQGRWRRQSPAALGRARLAVKTPTIEDGVRSLRAEWPNIGVKAMVERLRADHPDIECRKVRDALAAIKLRAAVGAVVAVTAMKAGGAPAAPQRGVRAPPS